MQPLPLVAAEVQRINAAFTAASAGLGDALTSMRERGTDGSTPVGTPACDAAVSTGMADLRTALARLQQTADDCVRVMGRHGVLSEAASPAADPASDDQT